MIFRYEGINENIDANFMRDYNETMSRGLGKSREDVVEVCRCIKMQLEVPCKALSMVYQLCDHLELCSMMTIITDEANQGSRFGAAWQLEENQIIQLVRLTTPLSLLMVTQTMALAQPHIERAGEDDDEEAGAPTPALATGTRLFKEIASDEEEDIDFLKEDLKKRQLALVILQGPTQRG
eukprot:3131816-Rhodomonas_salina.1